MKSTIEDKLGDKISDDEKDKVCFPCLQRQFRLGVDLECVCVHFCLHLLQ